MQSANLQERYVVLDVETTGLSPWRGDRVIEIGAVALEGGSVMAEFSTLIQVPVEVPFYASQINGITDEMLIGQPTPEEVFPAFDAFIRDSTLVAHNAPFDLGFLRREYKLLGTELHHRHICTLELSRSRLPHLRNHKLETVYRYLFKDAAAGIQAHRALDDARMVARIWLAMEDYP